MRSYQSEWVFRGGQSILWIIYLFTFDNVVEQFFVLTDTLAALLGSLFLHEVCFWR